MKHAGKLSILSAWVAFYGVSSPPYAVAVTSAPLTIRAGVLEFSHVW